MPRGVGLKPEQISAAFDSEAMRNLYPPILRSVEAAAALRISRKTLDDWIAKGRLKGTFRKRGKHNLFWRDSLIDRIFNGPDWPSTTKEIYQDHEPDDRAAA